MWGEHGCVRHCCCIANHFVALCIDYISLNSEKIYA